MYENIQKNVSFLTLSWKNKSAIYKNNIGKNSLCIFFCIGITCTNMIKLMHVALFCKWKFHTGIVRFWATHNANNVISIISHILNVLGYIEHKFKTNISQVFSRHWLLTPKNVSNLLNYVTDTTVLSRTLHKLYMKS